MSQRYPQPALAFVAPISHAAASCRFAGAALAVASLLLETCSHVYPANNSGQGVLGVRFKVDFNHISESKGKPRASRVGYRVRHKSHLTGKREVASFWRYGVELEYLEDNRSESATRVPLCKECHLARAHGDARHVNGTTFIVNHLKKCKRLDLCCPQWIHFGS
jgi:hypothetical protein